MINSNYNVPFKAIPINKTSIRKFNTNLQRFENTEANFVLLECKNPFDLQAVQNCSDNWETSFTKMISTSFHWSSLFKSTDKRTYALTLQKDNFDNMDSKSILGLANITKNGRKMILEYLQVNPKAINVNREGDKLFQGSGTAMIKSFQNIYNQICLVSANNEGVKLFYLRNGFMPRLFDENSYIWKNNLLFKLWKLLASSLRLHSVD